MHRDQFLSKFLEEYRDRSKDCPIDSKVCVSCFKDSLEATKGWNVWPLPTTVPELWEFIQADLKIRGAV